MENRTAAGVRGANELHDSSSTGRAAPASWQQVQGTVERGDQLLLAVLSQPGASCTAEVMLPGTPIQRTATTNGNGEAYWLITIPETTPAGAISVNAELRRPGGNTNGNGVL